MNGTHDPELIFGHHVRQDWRCLLQALRIEAYIGDHRPLLQIVARLRQGRLNAWFHGLNEPSNMARQIVMRLQSFHRGVDRPTARVSENHDHLGAEHGSAEFQAAKPFICYKVTRNTDHEQGSRTLVEDEFRRHT